MVPGNYRHMTMHINIPAYLIDSNWSAIELDHIHDLDGIVCIFLSHELHKAVPLVRLRYAISGNMDVHWIENARLEHILLTLSLSLITYLQDLPEGTVPTKWPLTPSHPTRPRRPLHLHMRAKAQPSTLILHQKKKPVLVFLNAIYASEPLYLGFFLG